MIDVEKLLRKGMSADEIAQIFTEELNSADKKIKDEAIALQKKKEEEAKQKEVEEKFQAEKDAAMKRAVAAIKDYVALTCGVDVKEEYIESAFKTFDRELELLKGWDGKIFPFDLFLR